MRDLQLYAKHGESKKYNNQISKIIQYTIQGYIYKLFMQRMINIQVKIVVNWEGKESGPGKKYQGSF